MNKWFKRRHRGQSIPLIALLVVVLFGMVGLAVDVGNTYAEQRRTVTAADAAAHAGLNKLIGRGTDAEIAQAIAGSFASNSVPVNLEAASATANGQRTVRAYYLDDRGNPLATCEIGDCGTVPTGATYIRVEVEGLIDTFFARIVGRDTLPVNTTSYARLCLPEEGVYPIAINASDLTQFGFAPPPNHNALNDPDIYKQVKSNDPELNNRFQRRIFVKGSNDAGTPPGSFSFLRWRSSQSAGNAGELAEMLTGKGTLSSGFNEVTPWPDSTEPAPDNYPLNPGKLTAGDWIHGNPGWSASNNVRAALDTLINNRVKLLLPIVDKTVGNGNNAAYKLQRLGVFVMTKYSQGGGGGANAYFDLIYIGDASPVPCLGVPPIIPPDEPPLIEGNVWVKPRWQAFEPSSLPVQYIFVMDFSGSMNWNFQGMGGGPNNAKECEVDIPNNGVPYVTSGCPGEWDVVNERRIVIARNALLKFVDLLGPNDTLRVVGFARNTSGGEKFNNGNNTFNTNQPGATNNNSYRYNGRTFQYTWAYPPENIPTSVANRTDGKYVPTGNTWLKMEPGSNQQVPGWTTDKDVIKSWIRKAGPTSDPNKVSGGTPGASGVQLARALFLNAPEKSPDGKEYKKVLIYLTDGVTNTWIDGKAPDGGEAQNFRINRTCPGVTAPNAIVNTVRCQISPNTSIYPNGWDRSIPLPTTQMINESESLRAQFMASDTPFQVYTLAVGTTTGEGLDSMADEGQAYRVTDPTTLDLIMQRIRVNSQASCQPEATPRFIDDLPSKYVPSPAALASIDPDKRPDPANGIYGYVFLTDANGTPLPNGNNKLPIMKDDEGNLRWKSVAPVPVGVYNISGFLVLTGEDQPTPITRVYAWTYKNSELSDTPDPLSGAAAQELKVSTDNLLPGSNTVVVDPLFLDFDPALAICPPTP
jgi:Flp pilus assembly protein TadG